MFYNLELLSAKRNGKFSLLWLAAIYRSKLKLSKAEYLSINIEEKCDEIMEFAVSKSGDPHRRFSLYLEAQLSFGITYIFLRQVQYLQSDVLMYYAYTKLRNLEIKEKPKRPKLKAKRRLKSKPQNPEEIDKMPDQLLEQAGMFSLPIISEHQLLAVSNTAIHDPSEITIREELPPTLQPAVPEGDFGDGNNPGIFDEFLLSDPINNITTNIIQAQSLEPAVIEEAKHPYPAMQVTVDVHPIPPEHREVSTIDPIASINTGTFNEIRTAQDSTVPNVDRNQTVAEMDGIFRPKSKSTPLVSRSKEIEANIEDADLELRDVVPVIPARRGRKRKRSIIDAELTIPSDIIRQQISNVKFETMPWFPSDLNAIKLKEDLFTKPAHNVFSKNVLNIFSWEKSGRQHGFDIKKEILKVPIIEHVSGIGESSGSVSALNIETSATSAQKSLEQCELSSIVHPQLPQIPIDNNIVESMQAPPIGLETILENSVRPSDSVQEGNLQTRNIPQRDSSQETNKQAGSKHSSTLFTKREKMKRDIWNLLQKYWDEGLEEIPFLTLCPVNKTNRPMAAFSFNYLLELHQQKKVILIPLKDTRVMGFIRKFK